MNPTLGFRAWAFKPRGSSVDSGRRDHLHFHLDREVMFVFQMSTVGEECCIAFKLILKKTIFKKWLEKFQSQKCPILCVTLCTWRIRLLSRVKAQWGLKNTIFPPVGQKNGRNGLKKFFWRKNPKKFLWAKYGTPITSRTKIKPYTAPYTADSTRRVAV